MGNVRLVCGVLLTASLVIPNEQNLNRTLKIAILHVNTAIRMQAGRVGTSLGLLSLGVTPLNSSKLHIHTQINTFLIPKYHIMYHNELWICQYANHR